MHTHTDYVEIKRIQIIEVREIDKGGQGNP